MTPSEFEKQLKEMCAEIADFANNIAPELIGDLAMNHFKENFEKEGFEEDKSWPEVERRKPESRWYGFSTTTKSRFSSKRAEDRILHDTGELQESITYEAGKGEVTVGSDKPYAKVHNDGGTAYVFGKKAFEMPKRQFIGESTVLNEKIVNMLEEEIDKILKQKS